MAKDRGKGTFAVETVQHIGIRVANVGCHYFDQNLARFRAFQVKFDDFEWFFASKATAARVFIEYSRKFI